MTQHSQKSIHKTVGLYISIDLKKFFYSLIFVCAGFPLLFKVFSSRDEPGLFSSCGAGSSHSGGLPLLPSTGSRVGGLQYLRSPGSRAQTQ